MIFVQFGASIWIRSLEDVLIIPEALRVEFSGIIVILNKRNTINVHFNSSHRRPVNSSKKARSVYESTKGVAVSSQNPGGIGFRPLSYEWIKKPLNNN
jgi:hypothetical protein